VAEVPAKVIAEQMGAAFAAKPERREEGAGTRDADHGREA
jgi:hypothetical protein